MEDKNRTRIIQSARELFNQRGYRSVTLDDIANSLGMSKKTIYQYFSGKEEIADEVLREHFKMVERRIERIREGGHDPVTRLHHIITTVKEMRKKVNPQFFEDIQKFAPELWEKLEKQRDERTVLMEVLIREGQESGLIKDINPRLVVMMYSNIVHNMLRPDQLIQHGFSVEEVFDTLVEVFLNGICSK